MYERRWALTLLDQAMAGFDRSSSSRENRQSSTASRIPDGGQGRNLLREVAAALGLSEGAARVAVHRLRRRSGGCSARKSRTRWPLRKNRGGSPPSHGRGERVTRPHIPCNNPALFPICGMMSDLRRIRPARAAARRWLRCARTALSALPPALNLATETELPAGEGIEATAGPSGRPLILPLLRRWRSCFRSSKSWTRRPGRHGAVYKARQPPSTGWWR